MKFRKLLRFFLTEVPGPKYLIVSMSLVASLAHGGLIAVVNEVIQTRAENSLQLIHLAYFLLCLTVFLAGSYFAMYKATEVMGHMMHNLRTKLCDKLARSSLRDVEEYGRSEIYSHLTVDIDNLSRTSLTLMKTFQAAIVLLFCTIYIGWLSGFGMLVLLIGFTVSIAAYLFQYKEAANNQKKAREGESQFFQIVGDELNGLQELKLNESKTKSLLNNSQQISDQFRIHYARSELLFFKSFLISQLGLFFVLSIIVFIPGSWLTGGGTIYFQLLAALLFAMSPVEQIVDSIGTISRGLVSLEKLNGLEKRLKEASQDRHLQNETVAKTPPHIALRNISLTYRSLSDDDCFKVGPVNLELKPNEVLFIAGPNGSGKTTLLKLLTGLYWHDEGHIEVDGKILSAGQVTDYRQLFSAVFTDYHLFSELYGIDNPDRQQVSGLLEKFDLAHKTHLENGRFSTINLSSGQRKRLALTAMLLEDRPIIVFDEFAADQDPKFREYFYELLLPDLKRKGKTVLAISHDDRYFGCCDRLIKLDLGGIVSEEIITGGH